MSVGQGDLIGAMPVAIRKASAEQGDKSEQKMPVREGDHSGPTAPAAAKGNALGIADDPGLEAAMVLGDVVWRHAPPGQLGLDDLDGRWLHNFAEDGDPVEQVFRFSPTSVREHFGRIERKHRSLLTS